MKLKPSALQPLPSEFPYMWGKFNFFISVQVLQFGAWGILPENDRSEEVVYWQDAGQPVPDKDCPFLHAAQTLVLS